MRDRHINPMRSLKDMDLGAIAAGLNVGLSTVYNWRKEITSPKAIQVYGVCCLLRLRPTTFAPYTGHPIVYRMPSSVSGNPTSEVMGAWVRGQIDRCRSLDWVSRAVLSRRCRLDPRTVKKCIESDDIGWDYLLHFIEFGLGVLPYDLLDVGSRVPIPPVEDVFQDDADSWSSYVPGRVRSKSNRGAEGS